ncbi:MAG: type II CRISPR-associated endonuclease Cas1 [Bacteroidales bacterium]|nr:type II CRISPR-associated endonuclease Cas1 [Bacteroidales bacterium]
MIKRTLYFETDARLTTKKEQLVVNFTGNEAAAGTVPIEDIGVIIIDAQQLMISRALISKLLANNVALITCDEKHMPQGMMLNLDGNTLQQERFRIQMAVSLPLKKNLWQQTIKAKIRNQAALLKKTLPEIDLQPMRYWEESEKSGDAGNHGARAANFYWRTVFSDIITGFKRGRFEKDPNNLLNYGYAILRAVTARSLVASGLLPTLGLFHRNKYNAYALADDIMEPYRPFVDWVVRDMVEKYYDDEWETKGFPLVPAIKKELLSIPAIDVTIDGKKSPLMVAMGRTTASLFECFESRRKKILFPEL